MSSLHARSVVRPIWIKTAQERSEIHGDRRSKTAAPRRLSPKVRAHDAGVDQAWSEALMMKGIIVDVAWGWHSIVLSLIVHASNMNPDRNFRFASARRHLGCLQIEASYDQSCAAASEKCFAWQHLAWAKSSMTCELCGKPGGSALVPDVDASIASRMHILSGSFALKIAACGTGGSSIGSDRACGGPRRRRDREKRPVADGGCGRS